MDKELEAGRSLLDTNARLAHYKKVFEIAEATVPLVPLYQVAILYGARKELRWTADAERELLHQPHQVGRLRRGRPHRRPRKRAPQCSWPRSGPPLSPGLRAQGRGPPSAAK